MILIDTDHIVQIMKIWHQQSILDLKVEDLLTVHQHRQTLQGCRAHQTHWPERKGFYHRLVVGDNRYFKMSFSLEL